MISLMTVLSVGCDRNEEVISTEQYMEYMRELGLFDECGWKVEHAPLADSLSNFVVRNTEVRGKRFVLSIDKDDVIDMGCTPVLYDIMLYSVHDMNKTLKGYSRSEQKEWIDSFVKQKAEMQ